MCVCRGALSALVVRTAEKISNTTVAGGWPQMPVRGDLKPRLRARAYCCTAMLG